MDSVICLSASKNTSIRWRTNTSSFCKGENMKPIKSGVPTMARYVFAVLSGSLLTTPAIAQDDVFEEIIVTATKRPENVMKVPLAVTAVTGQQLQASGIKDMFDLQQNVPGLIVGQSQTATTSNFAIRGIGSTSNNFGVESSVGLYVDNVYRSRQSSIINELVDIEAVEVLRGPQGTLFGKNTPAGAIQIRTVAPSTDSVDAYFEATAGDYGLFRVAGAANIPLSDTTALRGTVFVSQRDGYVDDDNFGADFHNDRDRQGFRLQLGYEPSDTFNMRIIADYAEIDETCCVALSRVDSLYSRASLAGVPVNGTDAVFLNLGGTVYTDFPYPQPFLDALAPLPGTVVTGVGFDQYRTGYDSAPVSENEDSGLSAELNWTMGNGMILTSISAYRAFDTYDSIDGDFTDTPIFVRDNRAEQSSFSQEFRLSGEFGDGGHWVAGAYYFGQEIESVTDTFAGPLFNTYAQITNPQLMALVDGIALFLQAIPPGTLPPQAQPFDANTFAKNDFKQDQDGYAVFGQIDIPMGDKLELTLGGRYTDETKDITGVFTDSSVGPPPDPVAILTAIAAAQGGDFSLLGDLLPVLQPNVSWGNYSLVELSPRPNINETLSDDQTTGTVKMTFFPNDDSMLYASYSTGFKSGGTNTDRINPTFSTLFGAETSDSIELGYKGDLGPVRLAVALYQTDFEDFQANTFTGTGFNLQNAGEVETSGIEIEALWRPTENFELQAFYAHNEADYADFRVGTCWDTTPFHTGVPDPAPPGIDPEQCDRTGYPVPYNPEDRAFIAATQDFPIGNNILFIRAEYSYASEAFTDGDLDPLTQQDSFGLLNLRVGMDIESWNSTLTLWGRNVTDERWYSGSFDAPIQLGRMNSYPSEPATYGVTFQMNFD